VRAAAVSLRDVVKAFNGGGGPVVALDHVTADVRHGELTGILGPSGCGKTTLLMQIGLLDTPTSGSVLFDGDLVDRAVGGEVALRDYRRKHIGFVFQKANLIPFLTAVENVALALIIDGWSITDAEAKGLDLLAGLDLADRALSYPHQLSGGQQQRVAIARALAHDPHLILADEPTAALDSQRGRQVMELLKSIAETRDAAVVVVTHDPRSLDLFDRILEMEDGRVVAERVPATTA
jgi:putative ABC transport system ATP-binding protein